MGTRQTVVPLTSFLYFVFMSVHTPVKQKGVYFITFTCFNWLPLIELTEGYDLLYNFFDVMKSSGNDVLGFVIMPNHVHLLLHYVNTSQSLNTIIGNGKRFIGYSIVKRLENKREILLLDQMKNAVRVKDSKRNKRHELWQGTFDVKQCRTKKFILQKLNYIHNNPCSGKWKLCNKPYEYAHSSARFYNGEKNGYKVKDYLDILAVLKCEEN
jgi:REP element-mobilizing transposase RayT